VIVQHFLERVDYANECLNPKQHKPQRQNQNPGEDKGNHGKKTTIQVKQGQLNFMGDITIREHLPTFIFYLQISGRDSF
jgi:hypothetical protein